MCGDGYVRELKGTTDDGDVISSRIVIGPFVMSESIVSSSILAELHTELARNSGTVTVDIYAGKYAEELMDKAIAGDTPDFTRTITSGRSKTIRPRLRGAYTVFVLRSEDGWASEALMATVAQTGRVR